MNKLIYMKLFAALLFASCSNKNSNSTESQRTNTIIHLSDAISNIQDEILLSELADSVTYIPFETNDSCLFGNSIKLSFSSQYIFNLNYCFHWDGTFKTLIGRRGQGPCEDPSEILYKVLFKNGLFYTNGQKLIEYDTNGICTGKERQLYKLNGIVPVGDLSNVISFASAGDYLLLYNYPDTLFFFNTEFEPVAKRFILSWPSKRYANPVSGPYVTLYNDTAVFYNYFTDTIFHVAGTSLEPKWIVELNDQMAVPDDYLYHYEDMVKAGGVLWSNHVSLDNSELCKVLDHKYIVSSVYETNHSVFLRFSEMMAFRHFRNIPSQMPMIAIYDKKTGKTTAYIKIIDDLGGMDSFYPLRGIFEEKMLNVIWPGDLNDFIEKKRAEGKPVDQKLLDVMEKVDLEDNPILIVAHLKNK